MRIGRFVLSRSRCKGSRLVRFSTTQLFVYFAFHFCCKCKQMKCSTYHMLHEAGPRALPSVVRSFLLRSSVLFGESCRRIDNYDNWDFIYDWKRCDFIDFNIKQIHWPSWRRNCLLHYWYFCIYWYFDFSILQFSLHTHQLTLDIC